MAKLDSSFSGYFENKKNNFIANKCSSDFNTNNILTHLREFLPKQLEICQFPNEQNKYKFWKIEQQSFNKKNNFSLIKFQYGIIEISGNDLLDISVKNTFQVQINNYNVTKDGYFGEIYINLDQTCLALVSISSVCLVHINVLDPKDSAENIFKGYIIRHIHVSGPAALSVIIKVRWYSTHNNLICILKKISNGHSVDTYFFVYNISNSLDVPVYKLKIDPIPSGSGLDEINFLDKKSSGQNIANIVDFCFGQFDKNNVWQEYTLYILDQYGFIYIYTPITFLDLNISSKIRMNMISSTIFHLLNSNCITNDDLSFNFVGDIDLLLSNSSESFVTPRVICTNVSSESEECSGFLIFTQNPLFIFGIITTSGKISICTSEFSLFPPIGPLNSSWSQAIDSVCMYTYKDSDINNCDGIKLFPVPGYGNMCIIYSPTGLSQFSLSFGDTLEGNPVATLNYGAFVINIYYSTMVGNIKIYSHPCCIIKNDERIKVCVYDCGGFGLKPGKVTLITPLEPNIQQSIIPTNTTTQYIGKEIETFKNEFSQSVAKIRSELNSSSSMVDKTFNLLKSLHVLHSKINKFNNFEKTFYCLIEKADERFKDNYQKAISYIEKRSKLASSADIEIAETIKRITYNKAAIDNKYTKVKKSFESMLESESYEGMINYYNNILSRIDCTLAEVIALYLQFQCLECQKIKEFSYLKCENCTIVKDALHDYKTRFNNVR